MPRTMPVMEPASRPPPADSDMAPGPAPDPGRCCLDTLRVDGAERSTLGGSTVLKYSVEVAASAGAAVDRLGTLTPGWTTTGSDWEPGASVLVVMVLVMYEGEEVVVLVVLGAKLGAAGVAGQLESTGTDATLGPAGAVVSDMTCTGCPAVGLGAGEEEALSNSGDSVVVEVAAKALAGSSFGISAEEATSTKPAASSSAPVSAVVVDDGDGACGETGGDSGDGEAVPASADSSSTISSMLVAGRGRGAVEVDGTARSTAGGTPMAFGSLARVRGASAGPCPGSRVVRYVMVAEDTSGSGDGLGSGGPGLTGTAPSSTWVCPANPRSLRDAPPATSQGATGTGTAMARAVGPAISSEGGSCPRTSQAVSSRHSSAPTTGALPVIQNQCCHQCKVMTPLLSSSCGVVHERR